MCGKNRVLVGADTILNIGYEVRAADGLSLKAVPCTWPSLRC
jgi:hypothetical protein